MDLRIVRAAVGVVALCYAGLSAAGAGAAARVADTYGSGARASPVDINSAGEVELRNLPGIGPSRAKAIVSGRPYAAKEDLVKRNIIPKNVFEGIRNRIVATEN